MFFNVFAATANHDCHDYPSQERQFVKHIHQIWNTKEIPEKFQPYVESCKTFNPGYNHTIWIPSERYEQSVQCCQRQSNKALKQIGLQAVISSETFRG